MTTAVQKPRIETERLLLRPIEAGDLDPWILIKYADPDVIRYMPLSELAPRKRAEKAFDFFNQIWGQEECGAWMVTDKASGQLVGDCYLESGRSSGSGEIELGYTIGKRFWRKGIATKAGRAAAQYAFERTSIERILGVAMPDNIGSWRVLEHIGFVFEKRAHFYDLDVLVYALNRARFEPGEAFFRILDEGLR